MISISLLQHQFTVIHDCGAMLLSTKASFSSELEQKRQKRGYLTLRPGAGPIMLDPDKIRWTRAFSSSTSRLSDRSSPRIHLLKLVQTLDSLKGLLAKVQLISFNWSTPSSTSSTTLSLVPPTSSNGLGEKKEKDHSHTIQPHPPSFN